MVIDRERLEKHGQVSGHSDWLVAGIGVRPAGKCLRRRSLGVREGRKNRSNLGMLNFGCLQTIKWIGLINHWLFAI